MIETKVQRAAFIESARSFLGLRWQSVTHVWRDAENQWQGGVNCTGLVLASLRECGLIPADFDPNLSMFDEKQKIQRLYHLLQQNAQEVPVKRLAEGDLMLSIWRDVKPQVQAVHHLNICTGTEPRMTMLQALSRAHGGTGVVCEVPVSALDLRRVKTVFRLDGLEVS